MIRNPVKDEKPIKVMGVDPGFASTGVSVVETLPSGEYRIIDHCLVKTEKRNKKQKSNIRGTVDDVRRMREICNQLGVVFSRNDSVSAIAVEAYTVSGPRAGNAWKSALVYGGVLFWGLGMRGVYTAPFLPMDVKRRFGKKGCSKGDIVSRLRIEVVGFSTAIDSYAKTKQEHISDATAHAILMIEEIKEHRIMMVL